MSGTKRLTTSEYLKYIRKGVPKGVNKIIVNDDFVIPKDVIKLPDVETVFLRNVNVDSGGSILEYFNAKVMGNCILNPSNLKEIGPSAYFKGDLGINNTNIKHLNTSVGGNCGAEGCADLISVGDDVVIGGIFSAFRTGLKRFNSKVGNHCFLNGSPVEEIGENAEFGGMLDCTNTKLTRFDSRVERECNLSNIESLKEIGEEAYFGDDLNCRFNGLEYFKGSVKGFADFEGCENLVKISENSTFGGIDITGTKIKIFKSKVEGDFKKQDKIPIVIEKGKVKGKIETLIAPRIKDFSRASQDYIEF